MFLSKRKLTRIPAKRTVSGSLKALTVAAMALPGLLSVPGYGADEDVSFQYGHYQEGKRQLYNSKSQFNPIEVDSLHGSAKVKLSDRIKFAFNYTQDTWSGATPITTAPVVRNANRLRLEGDINSGASPLIGVVEGVFDQNYNPVKLSIPGELSSDSKILGVDKRLVHTLSFASPETRKQSDFKLSYEWDEAAIEVGGGLSIENDYESRFGNIGGHWDFNHKLTSINAGISYTNSNTQALLDYDAYDYYSLNHFPLGSQIQDQRQQDTVRHFIYGNRQDWAGQVGLTQILNKNALMSFNLGYTHSSGFMETPYKAVTFMFVDQNTLHTGDDGKAYYYGKYASFMEQRPDQRNQWTQSLRYVQHIDALDAAFHFDYRFFHDDWGINAHTFEADWSQPLGNGWTLTPRVRYYSQSAADFYQPVFLAKQGLPESDVRKANGELSDNTYPKLNPKTLPSNFSSDHRLSGYGALSGGMTLSKQFAKGLNFELGFEYYSHAGSLKLGGGGEAAYADFNYFMANAGLSVNLATLANANSASNSSPAHTHQHSQHPSAPAGIMFDHALHQTGDVMVGYRYMYADQSGDVLHGGHVALDKAIVKQGCGAVGCSSVPTGMTMHMHMLDLMVAPTDWLTLMLMPQFVDMNMNIRKLQGGDGENAHQHGGGGHATGGVGDTGLYAITKLLNRPGHQINLSLGLSAPTGDVGVKLRDAHQQGDLFIHYGMQLGSGTWDFKPALTYTGELDNWAWGAQVTGIKRLESKNSSGFAFGDSLQLSLWGSRSLTNWLSASLRGVYTAQGKVRGEFNNAHPIDGPNDYPASYGGRYWDIGLGLTAIVPKGSLQGNRLSFEWLQPIHDDVNGYQVERNGALSATWSYMF